MAEVKYKACPKCGAQMQIQEGRIYTSIPPMYGYTCPNCGEVDYDTMKYPYTFNPLFDECVKNCDPAVMKEVSDNVDKMLGRQPVEDLEVEIEMEWDSFNKHLAEYDDGADEVVWLNLNTFTELARHFAEWGAEHLKKQDND